MSHLRPLSHNAYPIGTLVVALENFGDEPLPPHIIEGQIYQIVDDPYTPEYITVLRSDTHRPGGYHFSRFALTSPYEVIKHAKMD